MVQFFPAGSRRLLPAAILVALSGVATAGDPQLNIGGAPAPIALGEVSFSPSGKLLTARSLAGNFDCGTVTGTPTAGSLQLELDGHRYQIAVPGTGNPISYAPGTQVFSFDLTGVTSSGNCKSSGLTVMDLVTMGANGEPTARGRIGAAVTALLPGGSASTVALDVTVVDPLRCESFGLNPSGIDAIVVDANATEQAKTALSGPGITALTGIDHVEYRLAEVDGRRELRLYPEIAASGAPVVQCTSPGYALGSNGGSGGSAGQIFFSAFEPREGASDIALTLGGGWLSNDLVKVVDGSDGARLTLSIRNTSKAIARSIKVREYLRGDIDPARMHLAAGTDPLNCQPLPATPAGDPCASVPADPSFPLAFDIPELLPGDGLTVTVHRQLVAPVGSGDVDVAVGYAAFVDPAPTAGATADLTLGNNARWVNFAVS